MFISLVLASSIIVGPVLGKHISLNMIDGSYAFTVLGKEYQINVCSNDNGESYMSINQINVDNLKYADFVFGAFRDLNGIKSIDNNKYLLMMEGFQMELTSGNGFDEITYKFTFDDDQKTYELSRGIGLERYKLDKISSTAINPCFMAGGSLTCLYQSAVEYLSVDLAGSGLCSQGEQTSCFQRESVQNSNLMNSCWALEDEQNNPFTGGSINSQSFQWNGALSLQYWVDQTSEEGASCHKGTEMNVLDGTDTTNPTNIVSSWRCDEGHFGYTYTLNQVNKGQDVITCPIFNSV